MDSGLYITFFSKDEPHDRELPRVGPLDHVVLRHRQLVAERGSVQQAQDAGVSIDRWLEAELEFQRATGDEPGGTKRLETRITASDGVFLRFTVFGDANEREAAPELGPYAVVVVGPRSVEGDGLLLASRPPSDIAPWELTTGAGDEVAGRHKPDIAFRNATGAYHASIAPVTAPRGPAIEPVFTPPPRVEPAFAPPPLVEPALAPPPRAEPAPEPPPEPPPAPAPEPPRSEPFFVPPAQTVERLFKPREEPRPYTPPPPRPAPAQEAALTAGDLELIQRIERERAEETLRARIQEGERQRLGVDEREKEDDATTWAMRYRPQAATEEVVETQGGLSFGAALWRLRFAVIGVLLLGIGLYGFVTLRTGTPPGAQSQVTLVGIAQKVNGPRWDYTLNSVQRVAVSGTAKARGEFVIVRLRLTARERESQQAAPGDFALVDANGKEFAPEPLVSDAYRTNPQVAWPQAFPVGKEVLTPIVFDADPGKKYQLVIREVPNVRIRFE
jgi:hypothetical protein